MIKEMIYNLFKMVFGIPSEPFVKLGRIRDSIFRSEYLTDSELNHHVHVVGASGFGKTVLLTKIMKDRIKRGHGCLWLDLKGDREAINDMIAFAEKLGRNDDVQIFSISHPDITGSYNLISEGNATEIRDKIVGSFTWTEEYYRWQAMSYLLKVLSALVYLRETQNKKFDLQSVYEATTSSDYLESLLKQIPQTEVKIKLLIEDCYQYLNRKETVGNLGGLRAQLESLLLADFGKYLSETKDGINFFNAVNSQKLVFIFLDSRRYGESAKAIAKMLVKDLIATSARIDAEVPKSERKLFVSFIDEFADIADESFTAFPDRARSSRMPLLLSHQDLADLKRISEEFYSRMTANMSTLYAFLQSVPESADAIASRAGTKTVWKETNRAQRFWFFTVKTGDKSLREVEEFNVHPNVIKSLRVGECVVVKKYPHSRSYVLLVDEK
jgi:type IV secretory pathway TraG/TraD family ATPase VirD4